MPIRHIPLRQRHEKSANHELVVAFPPTGARYPSEVLVRGVEGRLGRVTTALLLLATRREHLLPGTVDAEVTIEEERGDTNWLKIRDELLRLYLETPGSKPVEFESHVLDRLITGLQDAAAQLGKIKTQLEEVENPGNLAKIALLQAENDERFVVGWGGMKFIESVRTGLRVAHADKRTFFLLTMKGLNQANRVFDDKGFEYQLDEDKPVRRHKEPWRLRWPVQASVEMMPREIAAAITAFNARCAGNNATEAYAQSANKLGIKGDPSPEAVYKAMRRLVTTLRKPEFKVEIDFLAEPHIDVDFLIRSVESPEFRELK
jgi:hypothetical protein